MIPGVWSVTVTRNSCHMIQVTQCPHTHKQKIKTSPQIIPQLSMHGQIKSKNYKIKHIILN